MDMKFKAPMSKKWELKDDRIIVGDNEYYFSEIKKVEHQQPQYDGNNGVITIYVDGAGILGSDQVFFAYKYSDKENGKIAAKYLIDMVKNTEYKPISSKEKKRKKKNKIHYIFALLISVLCGIIGYNITTDYFSGRFLTAVLFAVISFFVYLIGFSIISVILDSIFPRNFSTFLKIILSIGTAVVICIGIIQTKDWGGNEPKLPSNETTVREKCAMCGKKVSKDDMRGKWCKDCQNDAFGNDGWYYDIKD